MNCADFLAAMREDPLAGWQCVPDEGFVRIRTPLRYSDGGIVELYVEELPLPPEPGPRGLTF